MGMENINGRKKRKLESAEAEAEAEEEENEEERMEQFYALLRNTKDVRDRLRSNSTTSSPALHGSSSIPLMENNNNNNININNNNKEDQDHQQKKRQLEEKALSAVWKPSFQPEDFMEDDSNVIPKSNTVHLLAASSSSKRPQQEEAQEQHDDNDKNKDGGNDINLDLNLSL